jgi:hypothetical protein
MEDVPMSVANVAATPFTLSDSCGKGLGIEARRLRDNQVSAVLDTRRARAWPPHLSILSPDARIAVDMKWGADLCENMFGHLAAYFPRDLLRLVGSQLLPPPILTFATEISGTIDDSEAVRSALLPLLDHPHALVREGAVYGLREHIDSSVLLRLKSIAECDTSPGVRQAASDTLDEL